MRLGDVAVGQVIRLKVDGVQTKFRVVHHGKPDDMYDDSFLNGTILMLDCTEDPIQTMMVAEVDQKKGDYSGSYPHEMLNSSWVDRLEVADQVVQVRLPYRKGTQSNPYVLASGADGLAARAWLPSIIEVTRGAYSGISPDAFYIQEGGKFAYFEGRQAGFYTPWQIRDPDTDLDAGWGTRTPGQYGSGQYADFFCKVNAAGQWYSASKNTVYVRPCLVLPDSIQLDDAMQVTGGKSWPVKVGGSWKPAEAWARTDGVWRKAEAVYGKVNGVWREIQSL